MGLELRWVVDAAWMLAVNRGDKVTIKATEAERESIAAVAQYDYELQMWGNGTDHGHRTPGGELLFCGNPLGFCQGERHGSVTVTP